MTQEDILNNPEKYDLSIETVGKGTLKSPMKGVPFVSESDRVSLTADIGRIQKFCESGKAIPSLEAAGPRETIFHDPAWTRAGIVTCGGLCPGLNNVIKGLVQVLWFDYGVRNIFGIPYGYRGLNPAYGYSPMILNPDVVDAIQEDGGTILGSSRGNQDAKVMVDTLMRLNINVLFCIGGDGTLRGAHDIAQEIKKRKQPISVIGIPKNTCGATATTPFPVPNCSARSGVTKMLILWTPAPWTSTLPSSARKSKTILRIRNSWSPSFIFKTYLRREHS